MSRYERECRFRFRGDAHLAQAHIPAARNVLGLLYTLLAPGVTTGSLVREVSPGVVVRASLHDGMPIIEIDTRGDEATQVRPPTFHRWVPEGFVFYPASDDSPNGWGLPVKYNDVDGYDEIDRVFAPENLAPGLDVERWTPGGPLGQVLVTRKINAGYGPRATATEASITYPPLYHPEYGPHPSAPENPQYGDWQAYRLEFVDYDANVDVAPAERAALKQWKRRLFRRVNEHRAGIGREPFLPPLRGDYDSAQATCEWGISTGWWGHSCVGFPPTWKEAFDRGTKNGVQTYDHASMSDASMGVFANGAAEILVFNWAGTAPEVQYQDQTGFDVYTVITFSGFDDEVAFDSWMDSPPHKAVIEDEAFGTHDAWAGWASIGYRGGAAAMHGYLQGQWVQCGNRYWHSRHAEVPTLSWIGPISKNLHDEFWAVSFQAEGSGTDARTVINGSSSPFSALDGSGATGSRWFQRLYTAGAEPIRQGLFGPHVYARGRVIAIAPDSGGVLAAAIHKHGDYDVQYRLMILTLHRTDVPVDVWQGFTPKVRLWWVDLPRHVVETFNGVPTDWIAGNPHTVIRTKYGAEDVAWPWVEQDSPYSWRGGDAIDVNSSGLGRPANDMVNYASLWEFNDDATKAVCLRYSYDMDLFDWAPVDDGTFSWAGATAGAVPGKFGMQIYPFVSDIGLGTAPGNQFVDDGQYVRGTPVFCELTFAHEQNDIHTTLDTWTHNPAGGFVPNEPHGDLYFDQSHWYVNEVVPAHQASMEASGWPTPSKFWRRLARVTPIYAYYGADGGVKAVYDIETNMSCVFADQWVDPPTNGYIPTNLSQTRLYGGVNPAVFYRGVATGPSIVDGAACEAMVSGATHYSSEIGCNDVDVMADFPVVLHASDDKVVFAALGVDAPALAEQGDLPAGFPFNLEPRDSTGVSPLVGFGASVNPAWDPCDVVNTARGVIQLDVYVDGARVHRSRHSNPNPYFVHRAWLNPWDIADRRVYALPGGVLKRLYFPRWNTAWGLIGGFTHDRDGNWALALTYGVQQRTMAPTDVLAQYTNDFGLQYTFAWPWQATMTSALGPFNAGGFMTSSFATQEELAEMMHIPGAQPRAHYVRVV